ncbi:pseudouridine synthase [Kosmotoga arenicorallina S304]|uniref:Pseudouridine synthase n=1 Tax=Kosmotoga arenicorallina S304 TaxID=1453497 RepID=A0A182C7E1_9BACT|nr:pseudouridine synthase [Kosmotoga arenicorallina S304]
MREKLQRFLQRNTNLSRRKAGEAIKSGRVKVNGRVITDPWLEIDSFSNVFLDNEKVNPRYEEKVVYAFHKPAGIITAMKDDRGRLTIADLVAGKIREKVFHVGRLDRDTEGLLLLTNDGNFANKIAHPSSEIEKTYIATIDDFLSEKELEILSKGVILEDGFKTSGARVRVLKKKEKSTIVELIIHEGHKREVREMFKVLNKRVLALKRTAIGGLNIDIVPKPGMIKRLNEEELSKIIKGDR